MNPVKITILGFKRKAVASNLIAPNLKILTENSESLKTEENIQGFINSDFNWNVSAPATTYLSKSQLENSRSNEVDPSQFVDVSKYIDISQMVKQDLNDQRIDLMEHNLAIGEQTQQRSNVYSSPSRSNENAEIGSTFLNSELYLSSQPKEVISQEVKEEIKQRLLRKKKKLQIKNSQLVSYFADKKKNIYQFDPQLIREEKKKQEKLYRKPDFLGELKRDLVNDNNTVKFIEKNWFLFSQSADNPHEYMKGMKKVKEVYDELKVRIQKQQQQNLQNEERALIQQILDQQALDSPRRSMSTKKPERKTSSNVLCMTNVATASVSTTKKTSRKYMKSGTQYNIKIRKNQNFTETTQEDRESKSLDQSLLQNKKSFCNNLNSPINNCGLRTYNNEESLCQNNQTTNNYYSFEGETTSTCNPSLNESLTNKSNGISSLKLEKHVPPVLSQTTRHAKFDDRVKFSPTVNNYSSNSTRILDSRVRTTTGSISSFQGTPSRNAIHARKNTENDLCRNKTKILQISSLKPQQRRRSQTIQSTKNSNQNKLVYENNDQIFNFCHSVIGDSETLNMVQSDDYENEQEQEDFRYKINNISMSQHNQQNSQLSQRSQLSSSTTLQDSSRCTSYSLDNSTPYINSTNFLNRKRKYLNMNEIKISTYTAKELYLKEHNPLKYELYVVPQTTKDLISKANKQGTYLYQKQFTPKNYGQVSSIKRELIIS